MCGPAKFGCGRRGSPGIIECGPCLQNTQTHDESVVWASYREDNVELNRPDLPTFPTTK